MKLSLIPVIVIAGAIGFCTASFGQAPTQSPYATYIANDKYQIEQAKIQIEQLKLQQAQYRASKNEAAARAKDVEIQRIQNLVTLKQQEITMYTQQETLARQPFSTNPTIAAVQAQIRQLTFDKAQFGLRQTEATQNGNKAQADQYAQQANERQLQIAAKQQEIRLLELKSKSGQ